MYVTRLLPWCVATLAGIGCLRSNLVAEHEDKTKETPSSRGLIGDVQDLRKQLNKTPRFVAWARISIRTAEDRRFIGNGSGKITEKGSGKLEIEFSPS